MLREEQLQTYQDRARTFAASINHPNWRRLKTRNPFASAMLKNARTFAASQESTRHAAALLKRHIKGLERVPATLETLQRA